MRKEISGRARASIVETEKVLYAERPEVEIAREFPLETITGPLALADLALNKHAEGGSASEAEKRRLVLK